MRCSRLDSPRNHYSRCHQASESRWRRSTSYPALRTNCRSEWKSSQLWRRSFWGLQIWALENDLTCGSALGERNVNFWSWKSVWWSSEWFHSHRHSPELPGSREDSLESLESLCRWKSLDAKHSSTKLLWIESQIRFITSSAMQWTTVSNHRKRGASPARRHVEK